MAGKHNRIRTRGPLVAAALVVLAATTPAHARTEPIGGGPSHRGVTRPAVASTESPGEGSEGAAKTQGAAAAAGAIYMPFSNTPSSNSPRATATAPRDSGVAGLGLTVAVALAGFTLCGYVLRRAMRGR